MNHLSYDWLWKVMVVGDGAVGKTTIINRFVTGVFERDYKTTIGSQFAVKLVPLSNDESAVLQLWDVAGQARFKAVRKMYYSGAAGIIIMYDITREQSFKSVQTWILEAFESTEKAIPVALVGNKTDLIGTRIVEAGRGAAYAESISECSGVPTIFLETSVLKGENVVRLFSDFGDVLCQYEVQKNFDSEFPQTLESRVLERGWCQTKKDLACYDKRLVLKYLGFPELSGLLVTTEEVLSALPEGGNFNRRIDSLWVFLMTRLEEQVRSGGPTFDLDIDRLAQTAGARFVEDIISLRFEEIRSLASWVNSASKIDPWALWNTYYGRMLVKSTGYPRELNLQETKDMLQQVEDAGIPVGLDN
ncbi:MAG: Rab family GTPase [Promethearchaeota archaeon]